MRSFSAYHPSVLMCYFAAVIGITMFAGHPVILALALAGGIAYSLAAGERKATWKDLSYSLLFFLLITATNPLFSGGGITVLFFLNGRPVTAESLFYGMGAGAMIVGVMHWFRNYTKVMTNDKFLYLFGRAAPRLALVFSMVLRFIPLFLDRSRKVSDSQKTLGGFSEESAVARVRSGLRVFSAMVTWSFEMALETADSMKARGYGAAKRSSFSVYRFTIRDLLMLTPVCGLSLYTIAGMLSGGMRFAYYPAMSAIAAGPGTVSVYAAFACLVFLPSLVELKERIQWNYSLSRI